MLYKSFSYLRFLLKSTNQHGVHSPFVFSFVTKGLYQKTANTLPLLNYNFKHLSSKKKKILTKITSYFEVDEIDSDIKNFEKKTNKQYNLLLLKHIDEIKNLNFNNLHSKHIIVIDCIHQHKISSKSWQQLLENQKAIVSIDLFYFGLLFFRSTQAKEHFTIRV